MPRAILAQACGPFPRGILNGLVSKDGFADEVKVSFVIVAGRGRRVATSTIHAISQID